ncbi:uncharacterized protein LOC112590637 [Harpegnathos saltator]|uniref:uncharacterized protein LOC112590637 n=1 Tax=Harpegnathos saltator TaxID=610380 RepID=UPI000DBED961|nr:uncharacterized protein LOC112590637 [Harpegnathos saltator]
MGEIRIRGLEVSTSEEEAAQRVAQAGGCRVAEVQTGVIRTTPSGYRSLWMRCPLAAAKKVAEKGTLSLGWTQVKVELLESRPLQCYRCLERGHVQQNCSNKVDRRNICYRCGETDHLARSCTKAARCADKGMEDMDIERRGEKRQRPARRSGSEEEEGPVEKLLIHL